MAAPAIKINLFDKKEHYIQWQAAEAFEGEPGKAYILGHGGAVEENGRLVKGQYIGDVRNGMEQIKTLDSNKVRQLLLQNGANYDTPVVLATCSSGLGHNSIARQLSKDFISVEAPTKDLNSLYLDIPSMESIVNNLATNEEELREANILDLESSEQGRMKFFYRADYPEYSKNPTAFDSPETEQPNGLNYEQARDFKIHASADTLDKLISAGHSQQEQMDWITVKSNYQNVKNTIAECNASGAAKDNCQVQIIDNFSNEIKSNGLHEFAQQLQEKALNPENQQTQNSSMEREAPVMQ